MAGIFSDIPMMSALTVFLQMMTIVFGITSAAPVANQVHPEYSGYNCPGIVGNGTVPHQVSDKESSRIVCCFPTTCDGGTISPCSVHGGSDTCVDCPPNGSEGCNYATITSRYSFIVDDFCTESCVQWPLVTMLESKNVDAGSPYNVTCNVEGNSLPTTVDITFTDDEGNVKNVHGTIRIDGTLILTIKNVSKRDSGRYTCTARNNAGISKRTMTLHVYTKPELYSTEEGKTLRYKVGDNVSLSIQLQLKPTPKNLTCYQKDGQRNAMLGSVQDSTTRVNKTYHSYDFVIPNINLNNNGTYICKAVNRLGSSSIWFDLVVKHQKRSDSQGPFSEGDCTLGNIVSIGCFSVPIIFNIVLLVSICKETGRCGICKVLGRFMCAHHIQKISCCQRFQQVFRFKEWRLLAGSGIVLSTVLSFTGILVGALEIKDCQKYITVICLVLSWGLSAASFCIFISREKANERKGTFEELTRVSSGGETQSSDNREDDDSIADD